MTKFSQCFCLNLTNSFTRDSKDLSDFFKRARTAIVKPKTETQNVFFPIGQRIKHAFDLLFKQLVCGMVCRTRGCMIFNEIAKMRIIFFTNRRFKRNRFLGDFQNFTNLFSRKIHFCADFLRNRFATKVLKHLALNSDQLIDCFNHVNRNPNGTCLIRNGTRNRLPDPPCGVC